LNVIDPQRFAHLSEKEVLHRIGELLAIAIGRFEEQERLEPAAAQAIPGAPPPAGGRRLDPGELVDDELERQIVAYLARVATATPRELGAVLGLTKRTMARKLAHLRAAGLCQVEGRTRMACYRLRTDFSAN
jgi:DnaJ-domain-containing protein 1